MEQGLFLAMSVARRVALAMGLLHLLDRRAISPKQLQPCLGVLQWLGLRRRSKLSVYNSVSDLVQSQIKHQIRPVPTSLTEIAAQFLLGVYWLTDLRRPFLPTLSATDASTGHGFGASVAQIPAACPNSRETGDFVVLDGGTYMVLPTSINISLDDFVDISVSVPSTLPTSTCVGGRRFCTLAASRRHHVVLVDSACSCRKRSLSLEVMGGMHARLVLVPSRENLSHLPSRGARRRGCSL